MGFRPRILVVDDDPQMLRLLGDALSQMDTDPLCLQSSQQAAELIDREKFDGVFLDWLMPELDGLQLAERIRYSKSNSKCAIVMLTGVNKPEALRDCFRLGVNLFLQKPVSMEQIRQLLITARGLMLQERLRYERAPVETPVICQWNLDSYRQKAKGKTVNLSSNGMLVDLDLVPGPDTVVELKFSLPDDPQPFELTARAVRLTPDRHIGLRFTYVPEEMRHRLMGFVGRVRGLTTA